MTKLLGSKRGQMRRWIAVPLLTAYSALLILGALVPEVRPEILDSTVEFAHGALDVAGIRSGHVLMHADYPGDYRFQSYCMIVRGKSGELAPAFLFPEDGECPNSGLRPRLPPVERTLYRMLRGAWWQQILSEGAGASPSERLQVQGMLSRLGRHFCARPEMADASDAEISLAWYVYEVSYATGHLRRGNFLHYAWRCVSERLIRERWFPSDEEMTRFWGSEPWGPNPWE